MVINASRPASKPSFDASSTAAYEKKAQKIAKQLLMDSQGKRSLFSSVVSKVRDQLRWDDKLLAWTMDNPGLRVQMFRLIDCLPALTTKTEIASHFQAYLGDASVELPQALKGLLNFADPSSMPAQVAATTLSGAVETLARKYIAGENVKQVLKSIEQLRKQSMAFTIDLLGEAVVTEKEAEAYLNQYLDLMAQLSDASQQWSAAPKIDKADGEPLSKVQVSVKLTAFYSQFDPLDVEGSATKVGEHIRVLLRRAAELGVAVHFDMEQYRYKDATLAALKDLLMEDEFRSRSDIGMTLQAYLRDSYSDLQGVIDWAKERGTPVTVRLVKGAYWDQETITARQNGWPSPVYREKVSTDANFERMTQLLLEHHDHLYAAIGSHNVRSQAHAMAIAEALAIPRRQIELQVLYGMADKLAKTLAAQGYRVRVYTPFGELIPGMSYLIRRLLENTANSSFIRQNLADTAGEELLVPPTFAAVDQAGESADLGDWQPPFANAPDTDYAIADQRTAAATVNTEKRRPMRKAIRAICLIRHHGNQAGQRRL